MSVYRFDDFELDAGAFEIRKDGQKRHVEPQVFDLLHFFVREPGRVIGRDEIIEKVWNGRIVSDATISSAIKSARKALGDSGESQALLETVRGRGFRFRGHVETAGGPTTAENGSAQDRSGAATEVPDPALAILPFEAQGDDNEPVALADRLTGDLATILARIPLLKIASRQVSAAFARGGETPEAARAKLGVNYLLEGNLVRAGEEIRANIQLIETRHGFHLWAQQFALPAGTDILPGLLESILPQLEAQIIKAMFNELGNAEGILTGRQLLLQAMTTLALKGWTPESFAAAADLLRQSIKQQPNLALSHAHLSLTLALGQRIGMIDRSDEIIQEALNEVEAALELDAMDSNVLGVVGCALSDMGITDRGMPLLHNAIATNAHNAQAYAALGAAHLMVEEAEPAIKNLLHGIRISPMDGRLAVWVSVLASAYLMAGELELALNEARKACGIGARSHLPLLVLAAVYLRSGDKGRAKSTVEQTYRMRPNLTDRQVMAAIGPRFADAVLAMRPQAAG
ncbi:MAG: winged helix-turn-helix domain-containing protein [Rhizobiaceae bacterium]